MLKNTSTSAIFVLFLLTGGMQTIRAATLEVCSSCQHTSIKEAVAAAQDGDIVVVKPGTYTEGQIIVGKSIHLKGEGWPVLDGEGKGEILTLTANDITVEGFLLQNVGTSYLEDWAGIRAKRISGCVIRNNKLFNTFFGIYFEHCKEGLIQGNTVVGEAVEEMSSGNAIHLWYCKSIRVENNFLKKHRDGIYLEFVDQSFIRGNTSQDNIRYGLHFMFSNDDIYHDNVFRNNGAGVAVMFSRRINMHDNTFEYNWGKAAYGILLKEIFDAEIRDNIFRENTVGIFVEGSNRILYQHNDFVRNGWAIKVSGGCLENQITGNNFIANTFDLAMGSTSNNNTLQGNYWSEYSGYDLDRDGTGDVPYRPVKLFSYVIEQSPEAIVLLRSFFVGLINFSEKVSPVFTPKNVADNSPKMERILWK